MIYPCTGQPPYMKEEVLRALFLIAHIGRPEIKKTETMSEVFYDFLESSLQVNVKLRPSAAKLLQVCVFNRFRSRTLPFIFTLIDYVYINVYNECDNSGIVILTN